MNSISPLERARQILEEIEKAEKMYHARNIATLRFPPKVEIPEEGTSMESILMGNASMEGALPDSASMENVTMEKSSDEGFSLEGIGSEWTDGTSNSKALAEGNVLMNSHSGQPPIMGLNRDSLLNGIILAEVLGRPKAYRKSIR